ncbi:MAG: hypothetical protein ACRD3K_15395 [Edaphobacter sp.]
MELIRQLDLVSFQQDEWFWDLTCDLWAENEKNIFEGDVGDLYVVDSLGLTATATAKTKCGDSSAAPLTMRL